MKWRERGLWFCAGGLFVIAWIVIDQTGGLW